MAMAGLKKNTRFDLPLRIVLTSTGVDFFDENKRKLQKFRTIENDEVYGIILERPSLPVVQQLILYDYVSKIEVSREEFLSKRREMMDLTKLIAYGVLYKHFDHLVFSELIRSDLILQWNRQNPSFIIDADTRLSKRQVQDLLKKHEYAIREIKQGVIDAMRMRVMDSKRLSEEDKELYLLMSRKFLDKLRPLVLVALAENASRREFRRAIESIETLLSKYLDRSKIAEYLTLLFLELISNAENANIEAYIKEAYRGQVDPQSFYHDTALRERVLEELKKTEERLHVSWKLRGRGSSIGTESKLQVTIFNRATEYYALRDSINTKKNIDVKKRSLMEFYSDHPDSIANRDLGLYYVTYLVEECRKRDVHFESNVNYMPSTGLTVTTLILNF